MADQSEKTLLLNTLRRSDPSIVEILEHASHACLYQFGPAEPGEQGAWKRIGVEGPLYVVKRSQLPSLQIVIHNRKAPENLVENLTANLRFESASPYLMYKNEVGVWGIWFHPSEDFDRIAPLCIKLTEQLRTDGDRPAQVPADPSSSQPPASMDTLLRRLQSSSISATPSAAPHTQQGPYPPVTGMPPQMHPHPQALAMPPSTSPSAQAAALGQAGPHPHGAVLLQRLQSGPEGQGAAAGARGRVVSKEMIRKALLQLVVQDEFLEMLADAVSSQL